MTSNNDHLSSSSLRGRTEKGEKVSTKMFSGKQIKENRKRPKIDFVTYIETIEGETESENEPIRRERERDREREIESD